MIGTPGSRGQVHVNRRTLLALMSACLLCMTLWSSLFGVSSVISSDQKSNNDYGTKAQDFTLSVGDASGTRLTQGKPSITVVSNKETSAFSSSSAPAANLTTTTNPFDIGFAIFCAGHPLQVELAKDLLSLCEKANVSARFQDQVVRCHSPRCPQGETPRTTIWVPVVVGRSSTADFKPGTFIIWNLDQPMPRKGGQFAGALRVWEFSQRAAGLRKSEEIPHSMLPFLYNMNHKMNDSTRTAKVAILQEQQKKDLPVCLLGSPSKRRAVVVEALEASNVTVYYTQSVWGEDKPKLLDRCQIVLNIHFYQQSVQEVLRILEGIAHGAVVVSESATLPTDNDARLESRGVHFIPFDPTEEHAKTMKLEVMKQLEILKKASADDLLDMRKDSKRILDEWVERGAVALQRESDHLLGTLCHHNNTVKQHRNQSSCEHVTSAYETTK